MSESHDPVRPDWKESLGEFFQARLELFRLEAREAGREAASRAVAGVVAAIAIYLFWLLLLAGMIGWISSVRPDWPWWGSALIAAGVHLLVALAGMRKLREKPPETFPLTRNELAKDREWLDRIQSPPKSPR